VDDFTSGGRGDSSEGADGIDVSLRAVNSKQRNMELRELLCTRRKLRRD